MSRKTALLAGVAIVGAVVLYRSGLVPVTRDGSGIWPRFFSSDDNYDALEAHRARQRQEGPPVQRPLEPAAAAAAERVAPHPPEAAGAAAAGAAVLKAPEESDAAPRAIARTGFWPDFRGARRDGRYDESPIRTDWPREGLSPIWRQPIGLGYASFVAAEERAYTIEQRRGQEVVAAYDVGTGRELWTHGWDGEFVEYQGGDGPRATPTYRDGRLYALGALGELRSLDAATGSLIWRRNILTDNGASNLEWGMAASPLVVDDKVIVLPGGRNGRSVVAYDRLTGEVVWTSLDDQQAYTAPMLVTLAGVRQILVVTATRAVGLDVEDGRLIWEYPWANYIGINVAQPLLLGADRVFLSAGYGHGAAVFEVARTAGGFATRTIWQNTRMKNKFTSSVLHEGYIYGLDEAILACVDAATGDLMWKGGRYGYGQIVLAGDHVIVLAENGDLALVRATPEGHEELARFPALDGRSWNHPVIVGGRLLVRNLREMAAFDLRP
jgi:outer membrane protein assembly factor BamB